MVVRPAALTNPSRRIGLLVWLAVGACAPGPAAGPASEGPGGEETVSVLTLNIWHDQQDWPARLEAIVAGVAAADPDVICLQEVLQDVGLPNQAETLAARLSYEARFASWDSVGSPKRYGNAILARDTVLAHGHRLLDPADDYRVVVHARVDPGTGPLDVYCTHLHHTPEGAGIRQAQLEGVLAFVDATRGSGPVVLAGDFNARVGDPELEAVRARFTDAYGAVHGPAAEGITTLNTAKGHTARRIDHVLIAPGTRSTLVPRSARLLLDQPVGGVWGSDHFGVLVRFGVVAAR